MRGNGIVLEQKLASSLAKDLNLLEWIKNGQQGLPGLIQAVRKEGFPVVWSSDPMHGNTFSSTNDYKTRNFDHIMEELKHAFAIHRSEGSYRQFKKQNLIATLLRNWVIFTAKGSKKLS